MDFQIKKNRITIWERDNWVATIVAHDFNQRFSISINGMGGSYGFRDSKELKRYLKRNCAMKVNIPEEVYDHIDAWQVMFKLTSLF